MQQSFLLKLYIIMHTAIKRYTHTMHTCVDVDCGGKEGEARACVNMNGFFFIFAAKHKIVKHVKMCLLSLQ